MARPPGLGKCVHCLNDPVERDWDHIFPESIYPDTTPANLYKWQIPSCIPCNRALGKIEEEFLRLVALTLDPNDPSSRSIVEKAMRGMSPAAAIGHRSRTRRHVARGKFLRSPK